MSMPTNNEYRTADTVQETTVEPRRSTSPVLLMLPGSRASEIKRLLGIFAETVHLVRERVGPLELVVPAVPHVFDAVQREALRWKLAARIVLDLQTIVSREVSPIEPAVVTVGSIHGGTKHNIIPGEVKLQVTVRTTTDPVRKQVLEAIALHDLSHDLTDVFAARQSPKPLEDLARQLDSFRDRFTFLSSSTYGEPPTSRGNGGWH